MFRPIVQLPTLLDAAQWQWEHPRPEWASQGLKEHTWIGTDRSGQRWLVKMTGPEAGVRERVFSALGQRLGIACQSSAFVLLPGDSDPMRRPNADPRQLAILMQPEHEHGLCSADCPLPYLEEAGRSGADPITALAASPVVNALDWVRGDLLGVLCGHWYGPSRLWTRSHELVLIDNEEAWLRRARKPQSSRWFRLSRRAQEVATELCQALCGIGMEEFDRVAEVPAVYSCSLDLREAFTGAREAARQFLRGL